MQRRDFCGKALGVTALAIATQPMASWAQDTGTGGGRCNTGNGTISGTGTGQKTCSGNGTSPEDEAIAQSCASNVIAGGAAIGGAGGATLGAAAWLGTETAAAGATVTAIGTGGAALVVAGLVAVVAGIAYAVNGAGGGDDGGGDDDGGGTTDGQGGGSGSPSHSKGTGPGSHVSPGPLLGLPSVAAMVAGMGGDVDTIAAGEALDMELDAFKRCIETCTDAQDEADPAIKADLELRAELDFAEFEILAISRDSAMANVWTKLDMFLLDEGGAFQQWVMPHVGKACADSVGLTEYTWVAQDELDTFKVYAESIVHPVGDGRLNAALASGTMDIKFHNVPVFLAEYIRLRDDARCFDRIEYWKRVLLGGDTLFTKA